MRKITYLIILFSFWIPSLKASNPLMRKDDIECNAAGGTRLQENNLRKPEGSEIQIKAADGTRIVAPSLNLPQSGSPEPKSASLGKTLSGGSVTSSAPSSARSEDPFSDTDSAGSSARSSDSLPFSASSSSASSAASSAASSPHSVSPLPRSPHSPMARETHQRNLGKSRKLKSSLTELPPTDLFSRATSALRECPDVIDDYYQQVMALERNFEITPKDKEHIKQALAVAHKRPDCELSKFRVGTIILIDGVPYPGVNNESSRVKNCSCGERTALWGARSYTGITGQPTIVTESYVFAIDPNTKKVETGRSSSCGLCRQIYTLCGNPDIFFTYEGKFLKMKAHDLLPKPSLYIPEDCLNVPAKDFLPVDMHVKNILNLARDGDFEISPEMTPLFQNAVHAAQCAYAPYYQLREGAAVWIESDLFGSSGYKIFYRGNYQNASYGASETALAAAIQQAKFEAADIARQRQLKQYKFVPRYAVLLAFNRGDQLVSDVSPAGIDRQVAAEEVDGLKMPVYFVYKDKLTCSTMGSLLPYPFTFIDIIMAQLNAKKAEGKKAE